MKFIDYKVNTGYMNMQIDSDLLNSTINNNLKEPIFRLYGWKPACVSLGRNQDNNFLDKEFLKSNGIDVVRRLTGGRALLHDKEITYCYISPADIIPNGDNVTESYKYISSILIDIFHLFDINLEIGGLSRHITKNNYCMSISTGADLCYQGKKFIGSAQCRKNGYIMQHGSILLDLNKNLSDKIFNEPTDYSSIITLKEINPNFSVEKIISEIKTYLYTNGNAQL